RIELVGTDQQIDLAKNCVDSDPVAVAYQRQRSPGVGLGRDVTHDKPVAAARKPPVGDESDLVAETTAHDRGRRTQHLAHSRPAPWSFVAHDDHVAGLYDAVQNRLQGRLLAVEHPCPTGELEPLFPGN